MGRAQPDDGTASDTQSSRGSKVERLLDEYDLAGAGAELERRWLGEDGDRESLRMLAASFNEALIEVALERAGEDPVDGEVQNLYRLLTADDVSSAARTQAEARLSRLGVDPGALRQDFVSHQAIHTYLTEVRGASLPSDDRSSEGTIENRRETILRLRNRLNVVAERSLEALSSAGHLSLGSFDVMVGITVYCQDCGTSADLTDVLRNRGCECRDETA